MKDIDVVVTWVDSSDPLWIKDYERYATCDDGVGYKKSIRFESADTLRYLLRGVENFMPWVRRVYLVTSGHYPDWLDLSHPKLCLVRHEDIFPSPSFLPTFNASAIEMNLHRIPGLAEKFIYFNDDMLILSFVSDDYFFTHDLPNDFFEIVPLFHDGIFSCGLHYTMGVINKKVGETESSLFEILRRAFNLKYGLKSILLGIATLAINRSIPLLKLNHHPQPFLKSEILDFERKNKEIMLETMRNKFRVGGQLNQYSFRFWALISGRYYPKKNYDQVYIGVDDLNKLKEDIKKLQKRKVKFVCFNEHNGFNVGDYDCYRQILVSYLNSIIPGKSSYEIG